MIDLKDSSSTTDSPSYAGNHRTTRRLRILYLPLEFATWQRARHWSWSVQLGLEVGFRYHEVDVTTVPGLCEYSAFELDRPATTPLLQSLYAGFGGQSFDQVWLEVVHTNLDDRFLEFIATLAPVRVALIPESLEYTEEAYAISPFLRSRKDLVLHRLEYMTHALCVDEADAESLNRAGKVQARWWKLTVPARYAQTQPLPSSFSPFFCGSVYGKRQEWLEHPILKDMVRKVESRENQTELPALFDSLNRDIRQKITAAVPGIPNEVEQYVTRLRPVREACYGKWMETLAEGSAVVNFPSFFQGYAARVAEAVAVGRPVVSWKVPNRPETLDLFEPGKEILLFDQENPDGLVEHLLRLRDDSEFCRSLAGAAFGKLQKTLITETWIGEVLAWLEERTPPSVSAKTGKTMVQEQMPLTTVFVITVDDPVFPKCMEAIEAQKGTSFKVEILRNYSPFNAAVQAMIDRCDTEFFIQVDEDMILNPDAVAKMETWMAAAPDNIGMICFLLYDEDREQNIQGIKIYRSKHFKGLTPRNVRASEMDLLEQMEARGAHWIAHPDVMGRHGTFYTPEGIYHRYRSMYEKDIRTWNILTWDIRKKAEKYAKTGDMNQLFALLGAVHGIIVGPRAEDVEAKDVARYNVKELDLFKKLFLENPPYAMEYSPDRKAEDFKSKPVPPDQVYWNILEAAPSAGPVIQPEIRQLLETSRKDNVPMPDILDVDGKIAKLDGTVLAPLLLESPQDPFVHLWSGLVCWDKTDYELAWQEFVSAEKLGAPEWRTAWYKAIVIRDDQERWGWQKYELARKLVARVLEENPSFGGALAFAQYLNGYHSQWGQDTLAEDFFLFNPPQHKIFVDVGAYDGINLSNTHRLFENGWSGICIEPVSDNFRKLSALYANSSVRCVRMAVCPTEGTVHVSVSGTGSAITDSGTNTEPVASAPLTKILVANGIENIDFVSIDAEGYDFEVLLSLDLNQFAPKLIVIEYNTDQAEKKRITEHMAAYRYELWHDNVQDLFFRKTGTVAPPNFWLTKTLSPCRPIPLPPAATPAKRAKKEDGSLSIIHTVEFYHPHVGGAELVVQQLSERLAKRGHRVTVATTHLPERRDFSINNVEILQFRVSGNGATGVNGPDIDRYRNFLRNHHADVMMNYAAQQWATDLALPLIPELRRSRVNVIAPCGYSALCDAETVGWPAFFDYFQMTLPTALPLYDAAIYHSALYKDYEFAVNHRFTNSIVIHNGVDNEEFSVTPTVDFRSKYGITSRYVGLCVANFYPGKGQDVIVDAVRQMNRPDFTMVFIGKEGPEADRLQQLSAGLNIRFLVDIDRRDTVAAFHAADIFLFGSAIEASPLVIIEAKASRTPFVSTDCGNVREWTGGIVCHPAEIAYNANKVLDDESLRMQMATEGWKEWKEKLTWDAIVDQYEDLYSRLVHKKMGLAGKTKTLGYQANSPASPVIAY